ncbi:cation:proton antiporter [Microbacterium sp.]|uniref:cation:proton antiporter n=1 Tax=Microbacterium sp. TaxID=51671 RepID=UPI0039E3CEAF
MDALAPVLLGLIVIVLSVPLARRIGVSSPILLVVIGLGVSLLPFMPHVEVDPEWILVGILPPLLYAAAVRLPAVEFRRDAAPIAGLAIALVVISSLLLGAVFVALVPGLGFPLAVAFGAILSPTDAVATSIVKKLGIAPRVVTMLEGESLLNDATALVLLRSAIATVAAGFSFWGTVGTFVWGVASAVAIGMIVGLVNLRLRRWIGNAAANTALGFAVPFLAYLPTEHLGGSGLVAAVVAGITTGQGATRRFTAEQRISDELTWRTVELTLEGAVFLIMGLELRAIVAANFERHDGPWLAVLLAAGALVVIVVARAGYVALLVWLQSRRSSRRERVHEAIVSGRLDGMADGRHAATMRQRLTRMLHDLNYYAASPLTWKHGTVIVWAGMRGVVTLAAAQTLPRDTPARELLILTAFLVAVVSLLLQGLTLPGLVRRLRIPASVDADPRSERSRLDAELQGAALARLSDPGLAKESGDPFDPALLHRLGHRMAKPPEEDAVQQFADARELRIVMIEAMRDRLVELGNEGSFSSAALRHALAELDADQIGLELRRDDQ